MIRSIERLLLDRVCSLDKPIRCQRRAKAGLRLKRDQLPDPAMSVKHAWLNRLHIVGPGRTDDLAFMGPLKADEPDLLNYPGDFVHAVPSPRIGVTEVGLSPEGHTSHVPREEADIRLATLLSNGVHGHQQTRSPAERCAGLIPGSDITFPEHVTELC